MPAAQNAAAAAIGRGEDKPCFRDSARIAVALSATALPFARSHSEEAERWLRVLRVHGAAGKAMQAVGMPEEPFIAGPEGAANEPCQPGSLDAVIAAAALRCNERGEAAISTEDLFAGVMATYGQAFEHALAIRGTSAVELLEVMAAPRVKP
jgi:hypothetical protein